jgi:hypothetical protein
MNYFISSYKSAVLKDNYFAFPDVKTLNYTKFHFNFLSSTPEYWNETDSVNSILTGDSTATS